MHCVIGGFTGNRAVKQRLRDYHPRAGAVELNHLAPESSFVTVIVQKDYAKAAKEAVKYLAK